MSKFTPFGLCVKTRLLETGMTQKELEEAVTKATGLYMDSSSMHKLLTGKRKSEKAVVAICHVLGIDEPLKNSEGKESI